MMFPLLPNQKEFTVADYPEGQRVRFLLVPGYYFQAGTVIRQGHKKITARADNGRQVHFDPSWAMPLTLGMEDADGGDSRPMDAPGQQGS